MATFRGQQQQQQQNPAFVGDQQLIFKWDPKNLNVRTKTIQRLLEPLVTQVTTLANPDLNQQQQQQTGGVRSGKSGKGGSKKAQVLVAAVERSIENFVQRGEEIIRDNPDGRMELTAALEDVRNTGTAMINASRDFAGQPTSSALRSTMVQAARGLLSSVTRLLILADMIDVHNLLASKKALEEALAGVHGAQNQEELQRRYEILRQQLDRFNKTVGLRANDLLNPHDGENLQAARAMLKTNSPILYTASKAYVRHPEVDPARQNRDYVYDEMRNAIKVADDILQDRAPHGDAAYLNRQGGELIAALNDFEHRVFMDPSHYKRGVTKHNLEDQLEMIISNAAYIADGNNTRPDRKGRIVDGCNAVRQALQDLLTEYEKNAGRREASEDLDRALVNLGHETKDLRRHLRRAIVDHVSDTFLDTQMPLLMLIEAAKRGDAMEVEECGRNFLQHAVKLSEVAIMACSMSNNADGVKMVHYAARQVEKLAPQVVNAARLLCARPQSRPAQENMDAFKEAWEERVRVLTMAVDSIMTLDDFLAVSEAHILEDVKLCIEAVVHKDGDNLNLGAGAIRGRSLRVCQVVEADMDLRPADQYTEKVRHAVRVFRDSALPDFAKVAAADVDRLSTNPPSDVNTDEFIDAANLVHDGIKDIRHALLMNRDPVEIDSDEEYEYAQTEKASQAHSDGKTSVGGGAIGDNQRAVMRQLPEEDKKKIQGEIEVFKVVQHKFEREVAKWDEAGNDIVVLAKYMCMIMMEMTDFTRGRGPLKTTMDVINAAKKISEAGTKLNALAKQIADDSVESETKKDLLAYLDRITLFCHQLNVTSKVKADVQQVGDELIVSGLESATSLIQAAKNLLNAVVLTVKSAYIASTKYPAKGAKQSSLVVWKMRKPEKKPLVRQDSKPHGIIRRASQRRELQPIRVLADFQAGGDAV